MPTADAEPAEEPARAVARPTGQAAQPTRAAWSTMPWRAKIGRVLGAVVAMVAVVLGGPDAVASTAAPDPAAPGAGATAGSSTGLATRPSSGPSTGLPTGPAAGQDVSWPQCPAGAGGYGLPMPPTNAVFVVVGLTAGRGFTANPCVAAQADWARRHGVPASAYLVATYPTRQEVRRRSTGGARPPLRLLDRVYDVGWAQGRDAVAVLDASGLRARRVWIDVERNRSRPWSADPDANVALIQGVAAALRHSGHRAGLYTNASSWAGYTDGARLGLPEWRTVGPRGRAAALAACAGGSLNGGLVIMVQTWTATVDTDVACPAPISRAARLRWFPAP